MRIFAQKPKVPQPTASAKATIGPGHFRHSGAVNAILHSHRAVGDAVQRPQEADKTGDGQTTTETAGVGFDFSPVPVQAPASARLQTKLVLGTPGDIHEQEADRVAEQVMRMPEPQSPSAAAPVRAGTENSPARVQTKSVQPSDSGGAVAPPIVRDVLRSPGQPLDAATRAFMEPRFEQDFSGVRVHADAKAAESAKAVSAAAYTVGHDVVFGGAQFAPYNAEGKKLLAHELAHVSQNSQGTVRRRVELAHQEDAARASPASKDENNYEIALALSDFNPTKVKGFDEFKKGNLKYKPFKWYNYLYYEMPPKPFSGGKLLIADDWVFADTATGKILQDKVLLDKDYKPSEKELRQLALENKDEEDEYGKAILKGSYVYTRNYGWVDTSHAFYKKTPPGAVRLWNQIKNETGEKSRSPGENGFRVVYRQDAKVVRFLPRLGVTEEYFVKSDLSKKDKEQVALAIFQEVSMKFEDLQGYAFWSGSSFEPADLMSNMLSFYSAIRPDLNIMKLIDPLTAEQSLEVYRQYPGTFTDAKYKNKTFTPKFFPNKYCPDNPVMPAELQEIKPTIKGQNFRDWAPLFDVYAGIPPIAGAK